MEATNWGELLNQFDKRVIPISLVKEVQLIQKGLPDTVIRLDELDSDALELFARLFDNLDELGTDTIKIVVDVKKFERMITKITAPLLASLPPRF